MLQQLQIIFNYLLPLVSYIEANLWIYRAKYFVNIKNVQIIVFEKSFTVTPKMRHFWMTFKHQFLTLGIQGLEYIDHKVLRADKWWN